MKWIIYSLINLVILILIGVVILLLVLAVPVFVALCAFGISLSYMREQKYQLDSGLSREGEPRSPGNVFGYRCISAVRDQIHRCIEMGHAYHLKPNLFLYRSHQLISSATLAARDKRP